MKHMTKPLSTAALLVVTTFVTMAPQEAEARRCNYWKIKSDTRQVVNSAHDETRKQLKSAIEQAALDIVDGLKGQSRETSNFQQMQVEAAQRIQDGAEVNATKRMKEEFRAKAESGAFDPNPFSCILLDLFGNGGSATPSATASINSAVTNFVSGEDPIVQQNGAALSKRVIDERERFRGYQGSPNAAADWSLMVKNPTIDLSDPMNAELATIMMRNMIDATPEAAPSAQELLTPSGLDKAAAHQEKLTRQMSAIESMVMALNMRDAQMRGAAVDELRKRADETAYNRPIGDSLSEMQQLDIRTVFHYAPTGERAEKLSDSSMNEKAWLAEIHRLLAIQTRMTYLQLELMNRDAIVNGGILATLNDQ